MSAMQKNWSERLHKLGEVISKILECEPRRWKIIEHVRENFSCRDCEAITEAPAPSHPIPRGFAGPDLLAMVLAKLKTGTGRIWTYVRDDRPFGGTDPPAALFYYSRNRAGEHPQSHLAGYVGLKAAFDGYNQLYKAQRKPAPILEAACWSHGRRKFFDLAKSGEPPIASEAVRRIDILFEIERAINGKTPEQRLAVRREKSGPMPISKSGCVSSGPCSRQGMIPQRRSTTCSTAGRRSPASWMMAASASRTTLPNERCAVWLSGEEIGPSLDQTLAAVAPCCLYPDRNLQDERRRSASLAR